MKTLTANTSCSCTAERILAGVFAQRPTGVALLGVRSQFGVGYNPVGAIIGMVGAVLSVFGWWFALRGHVAESRRRMGVAAIGGLIFAVLGFIVGFVGPMIFAPDANQGPLLGIFITGPLGFVVGSIVGWLYARWDTRRRDIVNS